jgi:hypothetical protein
MGRSDHSAAVAIPAFQHVSFDAEGITACRSVALERGRSHRMVDDHGGIAEFIVDPSQTGRALLH